MSKILFAYSCYVLLLAINGALNLYPSFFSGVLFLILASFLQFKNILRLQVDKITVCIVLCILFSFLPLVSFNREIFFSAIQELIKYQSLLFIILIARSGPKVPLCDARMAKVLYLLILFFLVLGYLFEISAGHTGGQIKGFLANPNNYALTSFLLFFLIKKNLFEWGVTHALVIILLYLSGTSGAILGYLAGILYYLFYTKRWGVLYVAILLGICISISSLTISSQKFGPVDSAVKKIEVLTQNYENVISGKSFSYSRSIQQLGGDYTSALWRLSHWLRILKVYVNSSPGQWLFGHGIGSSDIIFGIKSHNDYLRILFEGGLVSFGLNFFIWFYLFRKMEGKSKWVVFAIAVFSFTENNYDHFLGMSLMVYYIIGNQSVSPIKKASCLRAYS